MNDLFIRADEAHQKREKGLARELRQSLWWRQTVGKGFCYYCGLNLLPRELTMDHKLPIVRGGRTTKKNVVACCKSCNSKKGNSLVLGDLTHG